MYTVKSVNSPCLQWQKENKQNICAILSLLYAVPRCVVWMDLCGIYSSGWLQMELALLCESYVQPETVANFLAVSLKKFSSLLYLEIWILFPS